MKTLVLLLVLCYTATAAGLTVLTGYPVSTASPTSVASSNCGGSATCYSMTVTSTTAGAFMGIIVLWGNTTTSLGGCFDGGDTFTVDVGTRGTDTNGGGTDFCYVASITAAKTTVFVRGSAGTPAPIVWALEFSYATSPMTKVSSSAADRTSACTNNCLGIAPTSLGSNNIVFQLAACGTTCSAINSSYAGTFTGGDGEAYLINTVSAVQPTWTQSSGAGDTMAVAFIAFKDGSTSSTVTPAQVY